MRINKATDVKKQQEMENLFKFAKEKITRLLCSKFMVFSKEDIEDIIQNSLLKAMTYWNTFEGDNHKRRCWLTQIAMNCAINELQKSGRAKQKIDEYFEDNTWDSFKNTSRRPLTLLKQEDVEKTITDRLTVTELKKLCKNNLHKVAQSRREIIERYLFGEEEDGAPLLYRRLDETAPLGTVKSKLNRGLAELRNAIFSKEKML